MKSLAFLAISTLSVLTAATGCATSSHPSGPAGNTKVSNQAATKNTGTTNASTGSKVGTGSKASSANVYFAPYIVQAMNSVTHSTGVSFPEAPSKAFQPTATHVGVAAIVADNTYSVQQSRQS